MGLREKALVAWHEAFGRPVPSQTERRANQAAHRKRFLELLRSGPEGIEQWNALGSEARSQAGHFRQADLSGCDLQKANLSTHLGAVEDALDFSGANLDRVNLTGGILGKCVLVGATLRHATLDRVVCIYTDFSQADLTGASLKGCSLRSAQCTEADFTGADLTRARPQWCRPAWREPVIRKPGRSQIQ